MGMVGESWEIALEGGNGGNASLVRRGTCVLTMTGCRPWLGLGLAASEGGRPAGPGAFSFAEVQRGIRKSYNGGPS